MSETTDTTNQMCPGFFRRPKIKQSLCKMHFVFNLTRVFNILETITGIGGIAIRKPRGGDGVGWTIDGSDIVPKTDDDSIEVNAIEETPEEKDGKLQIVNFPETEIRTVGISNVLTADPDTGALIANHASQYDLLVRVKNYDGTVVKMGYMPIGDNPDGEDPDGTGDNGGGTVEDWCQHLTDPDGGGGGGGPASNEGDQAHDPGTRPDGSGEGDGSDGDHSSGDSHPGKSGPCW